MRFFSFSCRNLAVLLFVVVHLESWGRREDVLGQLVIGHGFLSGLFTPRGCAAYGNRVCRQRQLRVCRQRQLRVTVNRGPYDGDFHLHMIIFA